MAFLGVTKKCSVGCDPVQDGSQYKWLTQGTDLVGSRLSLHTDSKFTYNPGLADSIQIIEKNIYIYHSHKYV
jgi:hypothetical protein